MRVIDVYSETCFVIAVKQINPSLKRKFKNQYDYKHSKLSDMIQGF